MCALRLPQWHCSLGRHCGGAPQVQRIPTSPRPGCGRPCHGHLWSLRTRPPGHPRAVGGARPPARHLHGRPAPPLATDLAHPTKRRGGTWHRTHGPCLQSALRCDPPCPHPTCGAAPSTFPSFPCACSSAGRSLTSRWQPCCPASLRSRQWDCRSPCPTPVWAFPPSLLCCRMGSSIRGRRGPRPTRHPGGRPAPLPSPRCWGGRSC